MAEPPAQRRAAVAAAVAAAWAWAGCQSLNTPIYFSGNMTLQTTGMATNDVPEVVTDSITLRFRNPSSAERKDLEQRRAAANPVKVPWIARDNVHLEVLFTVRNTSPDTAGVFNVTVDGASEYLKYDQTAIAAVFAANGQDAVSLPLMQSRPLPLGPGESTSGTLREDDVAEAESDLNAIDQFMAPFAAVLINRSDVNPAGLDMVPPGVTVPALMELDVGFTATTSMTCDLLVRVRDDQDQLLHDSGDTRFSPTPAVFTPTLP